MIVGGIDSMSQSLALAKKPHIVIGESLTKVPTARLGGLGKIYHGGGTWGVDLVTLLNFQVSSLFYG